MLIAEEANTTETAYLRLHLVPDAEPKLQDLFRQYLDSRLETYRKLPNIEAANLEVGNSRRMHEEIWTGQSQLRVSQAPILPQAGCRFPRLTT
jgi:hypothetical protein